MPTLEEISAELDTVKESLDAEQQQVADLLAQKNATIATLEQTIADLQQSNADGGTPEQRQAVLDKLIALKADLESTVTPDENQEGGGDQENG